MSIGSKTTLTRIEQHLTQVTPSVTIYWQGGIASPEPSAYVVLEPLFALPNQAWAKHRYALRQAQVRCVHASIGGASDLANTVMNALPVTEFRTTMVTELPRTNGRYEVTLTVETIT